MNPSRGCVSTHRLLIGFGNHKVGAVRPSGQRLPSNGLSSEDHRSLTGPVSVRLWLRIETRACRD